MSLLHQIVPEDAPATAEAAREATVWHVYGLIDPFTDEIFYIGCSINVQNRIADHISDPASSAWRRCRRIVERGSKPKHCLFASSTSKLEARVIEARLALSIPGVVNCKTRHALPWVPDNPDWMNLASEVHEYRKRRAKEKA